jgi:hypothetical protein
VNEKKKKKKKKKKTTTPCAHEISTPSPIIYIIAVNGEAAMFIFSKTICWSWKKISSKENYDCLLLTNYREHYQFR